MLSQDYFAGAVFETVVLEVTKRAVQESLAGKEMHRWFRWA